MYKQHIMYTDNVLGKYLCVHDVKYLHTDTYQHATWVARHLHILAAWFGVVEGAGWGLSKVLAGGDRSVMRYQSLCWCTNMK